MKYSLPIFNALVLSFFAIHAGNDARKVFSDIYTYKVWGTNKEGQGWSGPGSAPEHTTSYRAFLQDFLDAFDIHSVVDLGCGDWEFSHLINWNGIDYTGIDVVKSVIEKNRVKYGNDHIHFYEIDAIREELPSADLLICKDVLQHLTNADIFRLLEKFKQYRYCLLTNGLNLECTASNIDIERGSFRDLDLTAAPFNLKAQKVLVFKSHGVNKHTLLVTNW